MKKTEQRKKEDRELIADYGSYLKRAFSFENKSIFEDTKRFIKSENLEAKPKLELNRWIVDSDCPDWLWLYSEDVQYGIYENGGWGKKHSKGIERSFSSTERYATNEEIFEGLSKIAIQKGYKEKQSECLFSDHIFIDLKSCCFVYNYELNELRVRNSKGGGANRIFKDGKWANFIEETDSEKIERLEKEVARLKKLNKKS